MGYSKLVYTNRPLYNTAKTMWTHNYHILSPDIWQKSWKHTVVLSDLSYKRLSQSPDQYLTPDPTEPWPIPNLWDKLEHQLQTRPSCPASVSNFTYAILTEISRAMCPSKNLSPKRGCYSSSMVLEWDVRKGSTYFRPNIV